MSQMGVGGRQMTLEEAIAHSREKAVEQSLAGCSECSKEHAQLASWLEELKWRRAKGGMEPSKGENEGCG